MNMMSEQDRQEAAGEIISWKTRECGKVSVQRFREALKAEGFDESQVSQSSPKAALKRALRQLGKDKVIKEVGCDDKDKARFQLTGTIKVGDGSKQELEYNKEAIFTLNLTNGVVTADTTGQPLVEIAGWYADALDERTRGDIKRVLQRIFDTEASIFCINPENGGSYFVPQEHHELLGRVDRMLRDLGGKLARFPVIDGTAEGSESIADAMEHWFDELAKDLDGTIEDWDEATKAGSFKSHAERFQQAALKLEAAEAYLGDRRQRIAARLAASKQAMTAKILAVDTPAAKVYKATALVDNNGNPVERTVEAVTEIVTAGGKVSTDTTPPIQIIDTESGCVVSGGVDNPDESVMINTIEVNVALFIDRVNRAEKSVKSEIRKAKKASQDGATDGATEAGESGQGTAEAEDDGKMAAVGS